MNLLTSSRREQTSVILRAAQPDFRAHKSQSCAEIGRFGAARRISAPERRKPRSAFDFLADGLDTANSNWNLLQVDPKKKPRSLIKFRSRTCPRPNHLHRSNPRRQNTIPKFHPQPRRRHNILLNRAAAPGTSIDPHALRRNLLPVKPSAPYPIMPAAQNPNGVPGIHGGDKQAVANAQFFLAHLVIQSARLLHHPLQRHPTSSHPLPSRCILRRPATQVNAFRKLLDVPSKLSAPSPQHSCAELAAKIPGGPSLSVSASPRSP